LNLAVPELRDLEDQDLRIWETQAKGPLLQPGKKFSRVDLDQRFGEFWVARGERTYFQR